MRRTHFEDSMFVNLRTKNRLNDDATPTVFNVPNPPPKLDRKRRVKERNEVADLSKGKV